MHAYRRIEEDMREQIRSGHWAAGTRILSRRALAHQYGVQLPTLQRAIAALLAEGALVAEPRQGTVVGSVVAIDQPEVVSTTPSSLGSSVPRHLTIGIIGLIALNDDESDGRNPNFNKQLVASVEAALAAADVSSAFFSRAKYLDDEDCIRAAVAHGVDALILILTQDSTEIVDHAVDDVEHLSIPAVFVTADPINAPFSTIYYDQKSAGYRAADHLLRSNVSRIACFAPYSAKWLDERIEGAKSAVAKRGDRHVSLSIFPENHPDNPWLNDQVEITKHAALAVMRSSDLRGCGIIANNDAGAIALVEAGYKFGIRPGHDYFLVGFDDDGPAREFGISSLRPPSSAMGEEAVKLILRQMHGDTSVLQVSLQSHLVVRASSRPCIERIRSELSSDELGRRRQAAGRAMAQQAVVR